MLRELRLFFIALQFVTRVPVPRWVGFEPAWLHDSARHFPAVGLVIGAFATSVLWAAAHLWPASVAVGLSMAATIWLTGAFHEDGLADTADALGGHVGRERSLEIMKDSRIGSYGAVALVLALGIKAAALISLAQRDLATALLALPLAHAGSRVVPVLLLRLLPYAGEIEQAKAKPMAQQVSASTLLVALVWCVLTFVGAFALGLSARALAWAAGAAMVATLVMLRWLKRRLGGYTGDPLGAAQQGAEILMLLAVLAAASDG